jgi:hypothetical protein
MQTKHILILAGWGASAGTMIASLPDWHAAISPLFVGGLIGSLATQVLAIYSDKPEPK